ncbi:MAG: DUF5683 domain-containing protein [Tannerella sp.]|nr:DUF5683 domain-containing protein [Tannerella sp.]
MIAYLFFLGVSGQKIYAQDTINQPSNDAIFIASDTINLPVNDTIPVAADTVNLSANDTILITSDTIINYIPDGSAQKTLQVFLGDTGAFKPNPKTAYMIAAVFPGLGQIYNRQYWKLPIVYGGFVGFMYAITWNNKNYQDYQRAYFDIVNDHTIDPQGANPGGWSQSWQDFIPGNSDPATYFNNSTFQRNLQSGKDFYRRNRDLSIILGVAFYLICVADAYVDAQMFDFDVSPDLTFRITPQIQNSAMGNSKTFGFNICMNF